MLVRSVVYKQCCADRARSSGRISCFLPSLHAREVDVWGRKTAGWPAKYLYADTCMTGSRATQDLKQRDMMKGVVRGMYYRKESAFCRNSKVMFDELRCPLADMLDSGRKGGI